MHHQRNPGPRSGASSHTRTGCRVQRWVLLELITAPSPEGDEIAALAAGLGEQRAEVEAAVDALARVGLASRGADRVRPTPAALRFDALWPVVA
jgi:hypothetical protein